MNYYTLILIALAMSAAVAESAVDAVTKNPSHFISAIVRGVVAFALSWLLFLGFWFQVVNAAAMLVAFWIVFDPAYNLWKGYSLTRMGKTSFLDRVALWLHADMYGWTAFKGVILAVLLTLLNYV